MPIVVIREVDRAAVVAVRAASASAPREPLTVVFSSSPGGSIGCAETIADIITAHVGKTTARIIGRADSASIICVAACNARIGAVSALFAMHLSAPMTAAPGRRMTSGQFFAEGERLDQLDRRCRARIARSIGCDTGILASLEAGNVEIGAVRALQIGILTEVIGLPGASAAAAHRFARAAGRAPVRWTTGDFRRLVAMGFRPGAPIGIGQVQLAAMLARS
jgi:ATP-dependent protease ClpP protease subunit